MKLRSSTGTLTLLFAMTMALILPSPHNADALSIRLSDTTTTVTVTDNGLGDINPGFGGVLYVDMSFLPGSSFSFFSNVQTSVSYPVFGALGVSSLHLTSSITSLGADSIKIEISDLYDPLSAGLTGFMFSGGGFNAGAEISYSAYYGSSLFAQDVLIGSFGNSETLNGFGNNTMYAGVPSGLHSLTIVADISFDNAGGTMSLDAGVVPTPEPASLILMGSGLVGLGLWGKYRGKKA